MRELIRRGYRAAGALFLTVVLGGCVTTTSLETVDVSEDVLANTGYRMDRHLPAEPGVSVDSLVAGVLSDTLDVDDAVRVAVLNNRHLQATYESVGIAQADLVQAGLFENPSFDVHIGYPVEEDHAPDLGLSVSMNFLDFFHIPLRKAVAESAMEEASLLLSRDVLMLVADVQQAFYSYQGALQKWDMIEQVLAASEAAYVAAVQLREAGNIRSLDLDTEQAFFEQARLESAYAELAILQSREALNQLMGLWGENAETWAIHSRLPVMQDLPESIEEAEQMAVDNSLDLAAVAQKLETYAHQKGIVDATSVLPRLKLGVDAEREEAWEVGPGIGVVIPLFDQGQARQASVAAQIKQMQATYYGLAVDVRANTRALRQQVLSHYRIARHYQDTIVPLSSRISVGTQQQYNAMQIGVFQLLTARQQEIAAGKQYIDALLTYWHSHVAYEALTRGIMRGAAPVAEHVTSRMPSSSRSTDDH